MTSGFPGVRDGVAGRRVHVALKRGSKEPYGDGVVCISMWW